MRRCIGRYTEHLTPLWLASASSHWKAAEAAPLLAALEKAGHTVAYVERVGSRLMGHLKEQQPDAVIIDLSRLPSHGRMVAAAIRASRYRSLPLLFLHGDPTKLATVREEFPDALYAASLRQLLPLLKKAKPNPAAVIPPMPGVARPDRTTARKLGISENAQVSIIDAPRGYAQSLGPLPAGAELHELDSPEHALTLWFIHEPAALESGLSQARRWAKRTKLWILWRKGGPELTQLSLRRACAVFGLVDYKICSIDSTWSAMLFTWKK